MLTTNPWLLYASIVGPLLTGYYLIIGFVYYRQDLKSRIIKWKSPPAASHAKPVQAEKVQAEPMLDEQNYQQEDAPESFDAEEPDADQSEAIWENEAMMQQLEDLSVHLKQAIQEAHQKQYSKEELILLLQLTLREYPALYGTPFQLSVNNLIEAECAKYGSIHLSSADRMRIWDQEN